jgi:hypothetical protein
VAILLYLAGAFFLNILANNLSPSDLAKYWFFTYVFDIIKNVLFAYSIILYVKQNAKRIKHQIPYLDLN